MHIFHVSPQNIKLQVCNFFDNSKPTNTRFVRCNTDSVQYLRKYFVPVQKMAATKSTKMRHI